MNALFPILLAILLTIVFFLSAMRRGVVGLLSSGIAALLSMVVFFGLFQLIPFLAYQVGEIDLSWKISFGVALVTALFSYLITRLIAGAIVKWLLNPDSPLHGFSDGLGGGIISLFPSMVFALFLFVSVRVTGTTQELQYIASAAAVSNNEFVEEAPGWPRSAGWRNLLEKIPGFAPIYDLIEPFSNRRNRNLAAITLFKQSETLSQIAGNDPVAGPILRSASFEELAGSASIQKALDEKSFLGLVLSPKLQRLAKKGPSGLTDLDLQGITEKGLEILSEKGPRPTETITTQ